MNANGKGFLWLSPLAMAVALAACGSDDNDRGRITLPGEQPGNQLLMMHNGSSNAGQVDLLDGRLNVIQTLSCCVAHGECKPAGRGGLAVGALASASTGLHGDLAGAGRGCCAGLASHGLRVR